MSSAKWPGTEPDLVLRSARRDRLAAPIPVFRPQLPIAGRIIPYLQRLDQTRIYSNFGPLSREFEGRLAHTLRIGGEHVRATNSGTAGLIASILAAAGTATAEKPYAIVPSFSFVATSVAVERCGYNNYFADVDANTWALDPDMLLGHPVLDHAGIVVPVAPFGRPVAQAPWLAFRERTGIPVVIDAAAAFSVIERDPSAFIGPLPSVFSFHATKGFGIGEGGCVVSTDAELSENVGRALNFGFWGSRESVSPSSNGKMSEYHAAVGLAQLDCWPTTRAAMKGVAESYRTHFAGLGRRAAFFGPPEVDGGYALFLCNDLDETEAVQRSLAADDIEFRFWYGQGIHLHAHFSDAPRDDMSATKDLGGRLIGLPMAPDFRDQDIARVVEAIERAVRGISQRKPTSEMPISPLNG